MRLFTLFIVFILSACVTNPPPPSLVREIVPPNPKLPLLADSYFGEPLDIIPVEQVYALTSEQENEVITKFNSEP